LNNNNNANLVIDLFSLQLDSIELNNHIVFPEIYFPLDHAPLTINIIIEEEFTQNKRWSIMKNSKGKVKFINELIQDLKNMNISNICDKNFHEQIVQEYANLSKLLWFKHSYLVNIMRQSKDWWNESFQEKLMAYRTYKRVED